MLYKVIANIIFYWICCCSLIALLTKRLMKNITWNMFFRVLKFEKNSSSRYWRIRSKFENVRTLLIRCNPYSLTNPWSLSFKIIDIQETGYHNFPMCQNISFVSLYLDGHKFQNLNPQGNAWSYKPWLLNHQGLQELLEII